MLNPLLRISLLSALGLTLGGCVTNSQHISADFGRAVREDALAQIADPDARYVGDPAPASNGPRSALAQTRYERNAVIRPMVSTTGGSVGGGGGGAAAATK